MGSVLQIPLKVLTKAYDEVSDTDNYSSVCIATNYAISIASTLTIPSYIYMSASSLEIKAPAVMPLTSDNFVVIRFDVQYSKFAGYLAQEMPTAGIKVTVVTPQLCQLTSFTYTVPDIIYVLGSDANTFPISYQ